jgi:DNA-binding transcriptional regulator YiaG
MAYESACARTFRLAIETLGSAELLAHAIGASVNEIEAWAKGNAHPPSSAFLKAIDVIAQIGRVPAARRSESLR